MARAQGARSRMAFIFESVYGTAPASGYDRIPFASTTLGSEQPLIANELLGYGRDPLAPTLDAQSTEGNVVIPIDTTAFGLWLKATFGDPTTSGSGPYTHVFQSGAWDLPSFALEKQMPEVPSFALYTGCRVDRLEFSMERAGLLQATAAVVAQGEAVNGSSQVGALSNLTFQRFGHFQGSISRNGSALANIVSASVAYSNNLDRIETIRADGRIDGADPSIAEMTGQITGRFADTVLLNQATGSTACELQFGWEIDASNSLTFTVHEVYLPKPRIEIPGPGGVQATFDWQAALDAAEGCMVTVTLVNGTDTY